MATTPRNVLIIGDIHEPFCLDGYLEFCKRVQKKYKTNHTIFIGDVIDSHASSFHESDPDGYGAGQELALSIENLAKWHKAFPGADVIIGNHDRIVERKMNASGLARKWMRPLKDVLELPTWNFHTKLIVDDVLYIHGEGVTARTKAMRGGISTVQGHRHTEAYVWNLPYEESNHFGMQVGCGIDKDAYAFAYAKHHPDPVISCGVVLNDGTFPIVIPYND